MAVCLATTTGDTVDDDHIVELVREDDEVCLLDSAVITSYSPLSFHLQLNARSNFRNWLESRLNSPTAGIYLARCARNRRCDRCTFASQLTCEASHSPPCIACIQGTELYCSTFFKNPIPCRKWNNTQIREFETRVEYFVDLVGGEGMVGVQAVPAVPVNPKAPLKSSLKGGLSKLRDKTRSLSFRRQPTISEEVEEDEPSLAAQMVDEYHKDVRKKAIDRRLLKTYPHPAGPPARFEMTRKLRQLDEDDHSDSGSVTHRSNELYMPSGPRPSLGSSSGFLRRRPDPENDRTGRACSTPAHRAEGESGVERDGGSTGKNNLSLAEELQNLADSRRSMRGIPNLSRHSDSSFDHLSHRSRASQKTFVDPRAAQRSRRAESPPELLDQFEEIGQRSNASRVREPPRTRVSQEVSRSAQRAGASANLLEELALDEQAEQAALEERLAELRNPDLIAHRDSILGGGARQWWAWEGSRERQG